MWPSSWATTIPTCAALIPLSQKATPPEKLLLQMVPRKAFPTTPALSRTPVSRWTVYPGGHLKKNFNLKSPFFVPVSHLFSVLKEPLKRDVCLRNNPHLVHATLPLLHLN